MSMSLSQKARNFGVGRQKSGAYGLKLSIMLIHEMAQHRNWGPAAYFLGGLNDDQAIQNAFKKMVRLYFGPEIKLKTTKSEHESGFAFEFQSKDPTYVAPNTWAMILDAESAGLSITSKDFKEILSKALGEDEKEKKALDVQAKAKALVAQFRKEGISIEALMTAMRVEDAKRRASQPQPPVVQGQMIGTADVVAKPNQSTTLRERLEEKKRAAAADPVLIEKAA